MPSSLTYSISGSEGGRSPGGLIDLDKSLVGVDLTTTPGKEVISETPESYSFKTSFATQYQYT